VISQEDKGTILLLNLAWLKAKPDFMVEINFGLLVYKNIIYYD